MEVTPKKEEVEPYRSHGVSILFLLLTPRLHPTLCMGPLCSNSAFLSGLSVDSLHILVWELHPSEDVDNQALFKLSEDRFERTGDFTIKNPSRKASQMLPLTACRAG